MAKLCLNMIVRNEAERIVRCLESVAPYLSHYAILDTGSTDDTREIIRTFFSLRGIPGLIGTAEFINFEQARNAALTLARGCDGAFDYILLVDADMELKVKNPYCFDDLQGASLDMMQRNGSLLYANRRLVRKDTTGFYRGVTHEYLDIPSDGAIPEAYAYFDDHADGANRADKFGRDIALLLKGIEDDPTKARYFFYLAQSYRDNGQPAEAAKWYKKRVEAGGWDEEVWNAQVNYAHAVYDHTFDEAVFIRELLVAYNMRPSRAEPLFDLAHHHRLLGNNGTSALFSEIGMSIPMTNDSLFVNERIYHTGLKEEFSISAFYVPQKRNKGFQVCNALAIGLHNDEGARELARQNLYHYLPTLKQLASSFTPKQIEMALPAGYRAMNPSVARYNGSIVGVVRTVNYEITPEGRYAILGPDDTINDSNPINTRNFLVSFNRELGVTEQAELLASPTQPKPEFKQVTGFEDMRLFSYKGGLWTSSTMREMNRDGYCEQVLARINAFGSNGYMTMLDVKRMLLAERHHEKNWMPIVGSKGPQFMYNLGTTVDPFGHLEPLPLALPFNSSKMSGGSQVIRTRRGHVALIHEARYLPGTVNRYYQHRFVAFDDALNATAISLPFVFNGKQIEFAAGLAWHPNGTQFIISYGVLDKEAWLATVDADEVEALFHA